MPRIFNPRIAINEYTYPRMLSNEKTHLIPRTTAMWYTVTLILLAAAATEGCTSIEDWSYPPPGGKDLDIYGVKYKFTGPNDKAFKVYVHPGKKVCASVKKGALKPDGDGWVYAPCESGKMDGKYASLTAKGLTICSDDIFLVAAYKPEPCPANSHRVSNGCYCDDGYQMKSKKCVQKSGCPTTGGVIKIGVKTATAKQSSNYPGGNAVHAVDAKSGGHWTTDKCTATNHQATPWWSVELEGESQVSSVIIQNRIDCCPERLINFKIMVDDKLCKHYAGTFKGRKTINCDKPVCGKKLTIKLLSTNKASLLTLCDVVVNGRRGAGSKPPQCPVKGGIVDIGVKTATAKQSSNYPGGNAVHAVDAKPGGHWTTDKCTATNHQATPWWSVELEGESQVSSVVIQNRIDCCPERLINFKIFVDDKLCKYYAGTFKGRKTINCDKPVCGKKLTIKLLSTNKASLLTLCDVVVRGRRNSKITQRPTAGRVVKVKVNPATAKQSSNYPGGNAVHAVDAKSGGHWTTDKCTATNHQATPWWSVEFERKSTVKSVEIQNRIDCCPERLINFKIMVDNKLCKHYAGTFKGRKTINCDKPVFGKKLTIKLLSTNKASLLTLCDVVVRGHV